MEFDDVRRRFNQQTVDMAIDNMMARRIEELTKQRDALAEALRQVEFIPYTVFVGGNPSTNDTCMWCGGEESTGHEPDCPRQNALAMLDE